MISFCRLSIAALVILTLAVSVSAQDQPAPKEEKKTEADAPAYRLAWDMAKGAELEYRQSQTIEQDLFGTKIKNVNTTDYTLRCLGFSEEGSVQLEYEYDRVALKVETDGIDLDYDSADPDPAELEKLPELKGTAALVGNKFTYEITLELKVENLRGWDKIREQVLKEFSADMRDALEPTYSDAARISQLEAGLRSLPTKKVKVGDEWTNAFDEPAGQVGLVKHDWTLKLASVETKDDHRLATITTTSKLKFEQYADGPYKDMKIVLRDAKEDATEVFDMDRGITLKQLSSVEMTMEFQVGKEVLTQVMSIETTVELLPEDTENKDPEDGAEPKETKPD
ncbi:MAG: hypothetical protein KDB90_02255 [Planctomycetes bacterium]|nr:hypothetical protein [Planctomycetota bacterium]